MQERTAEPGREPTSPHPSRGTDGCHLSSGKIIKFLHRFIFWHIPYSLPARGEPQVTFCSGFQSLPSLWHIWVPIPGPVCSAHTPAVGERQCWCSQDCAAGAVPRLSEQSESWRNALGAYLSLLLLPGASFTPLSSALHGVSLVFVLSGVCNRPFSDLFKDHLGSKGDIHAHK